jgi:hypothetical protein
MRRRRAARRNPGKEQRLAVWAYNLLDEIWDQIMAVGGPELMPIRVNPVVEEYGSGFFGVALPTASRKWTLKLTVDDGEAALYSALHALGLSPKLEGIARATAVFNTCQRRSFMASSKPVFLYWRETATIMGMESYVRLGKEQPPHLAVHAKNVIIDTIDAVRGTRSTTVRKAALHKLVAAKLTRVAGVELEALAEDGFLVTDVHLGNWGIVPRAPDRLTLMDPGLVRFTTAKAERLVALHPPEPLATAAARLALVG